MVLFFVSNFHKDREVKAIKRLDEISKELPIICRRFFMGITQNTSPLTRLAYGYDLRTFFDFLVKETGEFQGRLPTVLDKYDIARIEIFHIELYMDYLAKGEATDNQNSAVTIARKISCLRAFFKYLFKKNEITSNIMQKIDLPKLRDKPIVRLDKGEISRILDVTGDGNGLTDGQKRFHNATGLRDETIIIFFLATGVRISELVGLNVGDIDMESGSFRITRKGGNQVILHMPDDLKSQLELYMGYRNQTDQFIDSANLPLFKSLQNKRISVRAVQDLVKKYAKLGAPLKNISPHKLRSTFGTNLYRATKDIYIVADVLGHADVNTTKKHYAAISDDIRKEAASKVKILEE